MSFFKRLFPARAYISYWLSAVDEHSLHSPFLFRFYNEVVKTNHPLPGCAAIENRRQQLLSDTRVLTLQDPGAGSLASSASRRTVKSIARHSLSSPSFCKLLYRLAGFTNAKNILELGTSLGISAAYLARGAPSARVITIEGSPSVAGIARETFGALGLPHIELMEGKAADILGQLPVIADQPDLVFIDAHHTEEATIQFFDVLATQVHRHSVIVLGDIHWSAGMERAWQRITQHPSVSLTLDVFDAGTIFFNPDLKKETEVLMR